MTELHINWGVGPEDAESDDLVLGAQALVLVSAAIKAEKRFEEVAGRSWWQNPLRRDDDPPAVLDAGSETFHALIELARYQRRRDDPTAQLTAASTEKNALRWLASENRLKEHGAEWADYWADRILELFEPFGDKRTPGRNIAIEALQLIIRHGAVCPGCEAIWFEGEPQKGKRCETCRRWDRRLKPYRGLRTKGDFMALLHAQGGECALCTESDPPVPEGALDGWHIDHDHATGKVRGILCPSCNAKVGKHEADRGARGAIEDYLNR